MTDVDVVIDARLLAIVPTPLVSIDAYGMVRLRLAYVHEAEHHGRKLTRAQVRALEGMRFGHHVAFPEGRSEVRTHEALERLGLVTFSTETLDGTFDGELSSELTPEGLALVRRLHPEVGEAMALAHLRATHDVTDEGVVPLVHA